MPRRRTAWTMAPVLTIIAILVAACSSSGSRKPVKTPVVDAGPDLSITLPGIAVLSGTASPARIVQWSHVSGTGTVQFADATSASTSASFSAPGTYVLQLRATNRKKIASDQVQVTVGPLVGTLLTVDPSTTYQTMTGWEATAWALNDSPAFANFIDPLSDLAVDDLGLNRVRLEIRAGVENQTDFWTQWKQGVIPYQTWRESRYSTVNDNADPNTIDPAGFQFSEMDWAVDNIVLPLKQRVEANGERLWINVCYVAFTGQIVPPLTYGHDDPDEYAEFVEAAYEHLEQKYGWVPDSWEVILEPDNVAEWNGTLIGQAIVAAAARLQARGWTPRFVAPSNTNMSNAITYFDDLAAVPGAVGHVKELSYHRYGGVSDPNLATIQQRAAANGIETAHLEWIGATYHELHKDLTLAWNSSWSQYVFAGGLPDNGGTYFLIDDTDPLNPVISYGSRTRYLRQYFRYVREGAVRVGATSGGGFEPVAFVGADGRHVVVVKAAAGGSFHVTGLAAGTYGVQFTTPGDFAKDAPDETLIPGQILTTAIPDAGVLTIHQR